MIPAGTIRPGTIGWFALHEARLAWRDWLSLMTGGQRRRVGTVVLGLIAFALFMHGLAYMVLSSPGRLTSLDGAGSLAIIAGAIVMSWSLMLSQALESVTRAFYARGDLELILTSPAASARLFAVRIVAMAVTIVAMALMLTAPFINILVWLGGPRWLCAYAVAGGLAMDAVTVAVLIAVGLFRTIGPRRTRVMAQVLAAVMGAGFAVGMQLAMILSYGTYAYETPAGAAASRWAMLSKFAPDSGSALLWPARAVLGEPVALIGLLGFSVAAMAATIYVFAPRFGQLALAAGSAANGPALRGGARRSGRQSYFHDRLPAPALRRKEWTLLLRDPWLLSQTLMQLLYLLPAGFLLWRDFHGGGNVSMLLVPVLIVASGQLGGGLAWLAVSGEDAPDLIASAPVPASHVLRAKVEAVLCCIAVIFAPFAVTLAFAAPCAALVAFAGTIIAAGSATAIQYWFRAQARRSLFRRRQTSSRVATFAEALSSTLWAGTGALAASGTWLAIVPGVAVLAIVGGAWMISPERGPSRA
jgi:ABC-2 type transport system permease protein